MGVISYPTVGNCSWSADVEFIANKPYDGDNGTNRPNIPDSALVYALIGQKNAYASPLNCQGGLQYRPNVGGTGAVYISEVHSINKYRPNNGVFFVDTGTYYSTNDNTNQILNVTADGYIHTRTNASGGYNGFTRSSAYPTTGINNFAQRIKNVNSNWSNTYPWLTSPTRQIKTSGSVQMSTSRCLIYYGRWDDIKARLSGQVRDFTLYRNLSDSDGTLNMFNDQHNNFWNPAIVYDVCYPTSEGLKNDGLKPGYADVCTFTRKYPLNNTNKDSTWSITYEEREVFNPNGETNFLVLDLTFTNQYGNQLTQTLTDYQGCDNPRVSGFNPIYGGDNCKCAEGLLECRDKSGNVCCVDCCEVGKEVFHIMQGVATL